MILIFSLACSEFTLREPDPVPVATPPGDTLDDAGQPPDWQSCESGYIGRYYNLPADHPDVEAEEDTAAPLPDPLTVDWWSDDWFSFQRYDPGLDFGEAWWPVDQDIEGDPAYFSVAWNAWLRVTTGGAQSLLFGARGDAWVFIAGAPVVEAHEIEAFNATTYVLDLDAGVYPIEVRYAQRIGDQSGFRLRWLSESAVICYPDF